MPYIIETTTDTDRMLKPRPSGPGFSPDEALAASRMEIWGSSFSDPGDDWCEYRLLTPQGGFIAVVRLPGMKPLKNPLAKGQLGPARGSCRQRQLVRGAASTKTPHS